MAERGKAEEPQRTEADDPSAELERLPPRIREALERSESGVGVVFLFDDLMRVDVDPPAADVDIEAKQASTPITVRTTGEHSLKARASVVVADALDEAGPPFERDDAYYDEVRRAVGRGAPSVLLGTSTRSLERNLLKTKAEYSTASRSDQPPAPRSGQSWFQSPAAFAMRVFATALVVYGAALGVLALLVHHPAWYVFMVALIFPIVTTLMAWRALRLERRYKERSDALEEMVRAARLLAEAEKMPRQSSGEREETRKRR